MATYIADEKVDVYREAVYLLAASFYRLCRLALYPHARACKARAEKLAAIAEIACPKMFNPWIY